MNNLKAEIKWQIIKKSKTSALFWHTLRLPLHHNFKKWYGTESDEQICMVS